MQGGVGIVSLKNSFRLCLRIQSVGSSCHEKPCTILTLHLTSDLRLLRMAATPMAHFMLFCLNTGIEISKVLDHSQNKAGEQFSLITQNISSDEVVGKHEGFFQGHFPFHHSAKAAPEPGLCSKTCTWTW